MLDGLQCLRHTQSCCIWRVTQLVTTGLSKPLRTPGIHSKHDLLYIHTRSNDRTTNSISSTKTVLGNALIILLPQGLREPLRHVQRAVISSNVTCCQQQQSDGLPVLLLLTLLTATLLLQYLCPAYNATAGRLRE
jgi:hypothetical protein